MGEIKLFVCCHRPAPVPAHPLLVPLQVGAALSEQRLPGLLQDDRGENISAKNRAYCELTGQYWAWKNVRADHYGFFHYRRYLYPDPAARLPYRIEGEPTAGLLDRLGFERLAELIGRYDLILPKGEDMRLPVRAHYASAPFHRGDDLALAEEVLLAREPAYARAAEEYLSGTMCYFGNIFIMRREVFFHYCRWLFPILAEFDRRTDPSRRSFQEGRVDGYLAERLLGVYAAHHRGGLRTLELPRVHFIPGLARRLGTRAVNLLLPPGSVRRSKIKAWKG